MSLLKSFIIFFRQQVNGKLYNIFGVVHRSRNELVLLVEMTTFIEPCMDTQRKVTFLSYPQKDTFLSRFKLININK